jgi:molybdopterin molybdotransferase
MLLPVDEALAIVRRETTPLGAERVSLDRALSRVLAEDVHADRPLPPFDRSAMDGFAVRSADAPSPGAVLRISGEVRAGQWPERVAVGSGEAVRIMTGAPVPEGADAVQPVEKTRPVTGGCVELTTAVAAGANVTPRGSEVAEGERVLARGRRLDPAAIAVLAAVGVDEPLVGRRPRAAILVTGDEVVPVGERPAVAQVRNCNGPALAALCREAGAHVRDLGIAADEREAIARAVALGLEADVLLVSGGVSAGDYDLVEPVLQAAGVSFFFTGVAMKPGAPLVFGRRGATLVFGLPGNPVSTQVTFARFVRPCLLDLQGGRATAARRVPVTLATPVANRSGRTTHLPAVVRLEADRLVALPVLTQGSGDLASHARANALVVLEPASAGVEAGETAEAIPLGRFLEDDDAPL